MSGFTEIVVVALVAQLAVLPGEKVQFIIAGLSTRYSPLVVVSAAGTAFAGWTALEIWFGQALKTALPPVVLDAVTVVLFTVFAVLLWRSAPDEHATPEDVAASTDGGFAAAPNVNLPTVAGYDLSSSFGGFLPIFVMMAAGEFGDKTQLVTIGLAVQYGATPAIWVGEMLAIIPVSLANAYFFNRFSHRFDVRRAHQFAAGLFAFFAADTVLSILTGFSVWETAVGAVSDAVLTLL
ncbi:Putative Ca2+/H+ antiporter, TMEM165/GDT1 family [Halogranum rubrum]|uniref:Putative Ca2+/H+ antiporter, TMEM165/GDT1 family n=1 Tax=Halogranum rubrum TaxID=553466 RepID=A0A1I4EE21_9EURY|nr:TMEM165/GDT1 family protein [Halogranum rubrum]SFL03449.1 Putative Ca2+/H+ antiporter, TMEM165/GDT1 family [Halogranum rubrum]